MFLSQRVYYQEAKPALDPTPAKAPDPSGEDGSGADGAGGDGVGGAGPSGTGDGTGTETAAATMKAVMH